MTGITKNRASQPTGAETSPNVARPRRLRGRSPSPVRPTRSAVASLATFVNRRPLRGLHFVPGPVVGVALRLVPVDVAGGLGQRALGVVEPEDLDELGVDLVQVDVEVRVPVAPRVDQVQ